MFQMIVLQFMILPIFYYIDNLLEFFDAFNNTHCLNNNLNTQIEHQKYKSKGSWQIFLYFTEILLVWHQKSNKQELTVLSL